MSKESDDYFIDRALGAYPEMDVPLSGGGGESMGTLFIVVCMQGLLWLVGIYLLVQFVKWSW